MRVRTWVLAAALFLGCPAWAQVPDATPRATSLASFLGTTSAVSGVTMASGFLLADAFGTPNRPVKNEPSRIPDQGLVTLGAVGFVVGAVTTSFGIPASLLAQLNAVNALPADRRSKWALYTQLVLYPVCILTAAGTVIGYAAGRNHLPMLGFATSLLSVGVLTRVQLKTNQREREQMVAAVRLFRASVHTERLDRGPFDDPAHLGLSPFEREGPTGRVDDLDALVVGPEGLGSVAERGGQRALGLQLLDARPAGALSDVEPQAVPGVLAGSADGQLDHL